MTSRGKTPPSRQRGLVLILLLLLVSVGALAVFVTALNRAGQQQERDRITNQALAQAKAALIGRAAADSNRPGSLPCPDTNNDGVADLLSGVDCPAYLGRLPWKTLGLPDLRDGYGERLWYELSGKFKDDASAEPLNSDVTVGDLEAPGSHIAAKLYSPGPPLGAQVRDTANALVAANYLEGINDLSLRVYDQAIFSATRRRIAGEIRALLVDPYPSSLPVPAPPLRYTQNWLMAVTNPTSSPVTDTAQFTITGCQYTITWNAALGRSDMSWTGSC